MTAIAAVVDAGKVWIGGDSVGADSGWRKIIRADSKVFVNGPFVMGFTTSFRMGQLLRWSFDPPVCPADTDVERFMSTTFVDGVRDCLKKGGFAKKENEIEQGGNFLVGYQGIIWEIASDYQVGLSHDLYNAVGSGGETCVGSLHTTADMDMDPRDRLQRALRAAANHNAGVGPPFVFVREP